MNVTLVHPAAAALGGLEAVYLHSFPPEERRPWEQIVCPENAGGPVLLAIDDGSGVCAGLLTFWEFDAFVYIEHFAVSPALRGTGVGSRAIECFIASRTKPVVLEVEPENVSDPMTLRRISFYRRHGLEILDYDYVQPPYGAGLPPVPLRLMSTDSSIDASAVAAALYRRVYGQP